MAKLIGNIAFATFSLIASIYFWFISDGFPVFEKYRKVDSDFWPKILMTMIAIVSLGVIYQSIVELRISLAKRALDGSEAIDDSFAAGVDWKKFAIMGGLCIGYFYGLQWAGFLISTHVFLWISLSFIGLRSKFLKIFYPLIFTSALTFMFVKILELSLPRGQWIFREFSLLFY